MSRKRLTIPVQFVIPYAFTFETVMGVPNNFFNTFMRLQAKVPHENWTLKTNDSDDPAHWQTIMNHDGLRRSGRTKIMQMELAWATAIKPALQAVPSLEVNDYNAWFQVADLSATVPTGMPHSEVGMTWQEWANQGVRRNDTPEDVTPTRDIPALSDGNYYVSSAWYNENGTWMPGTELLVADTAGATIVEESNLPAPVPSED